MSIVRAGSLLSCSLLIGFFGLFSPQGVAAEGISDQSIRLVIGMQAGVEGAQIGQLAADYGATVVADSQVLGLLIIEAPGKNRIDLERSLLNDPKVRFVEADAQASINFSPNDPAYHNSNLVYGPQQIGAAIIWDQTLGSPSIVIAILDTGIDLSHPEFAGRILPGWDIVNGDSDASDDHGHGTHVAGIAAAGTHNGIGMAGMAGQASILPVKVLDDAGQGWMSDIAQGIVWAVDQGAQVINLSLGGDQDSLALRDAVNYAVLHDVMLVAAGGNSATSTPQYPASYSEVLAVGASQYDGTRWQYSNTGSNVDLLAPGNMIYSTHWRAGSSNRFSFMSGTSMAAPHVSGLVALLRSVDFTITSGEVRDLLLNTASDLGESGPDPLNGYGLVNGAAAISTLVNLPHLGDCNGDQLVDAGDAAALILEIFDGDGNDPLAAGGGTFTGHATGCNANQDSTIDAGDFSCLIMLIFNGPAACGTGSGTGAQQGSGDGSHPSNVAGLALPSQLPAQAGSSITVPVAFDSGSLAISSLIFSIDYDEQWLSFDPSDANLDGIPDAVAFHLPGAFHASASFDPQDVDGELDIVISDFLLPLAALPSGNLMEITFTAGQPGTSTEAALRFSVEPPASFGDDTGHSVVGSTMDGSVLIGAVGASSARTAVFLPMAMRAG